MRVCRTCLNVVKDAEFYNLNQPYPNSECPILRDVCRSCIPDLDLDLTSDPILCGACYNTFNLFYKLRNSCVASEGSIRNMLEVKGFIDLSVLAAGDIAKNIKNEAPINVKLEPPDEITELLHQDINPSFGKDITNCEKRPSSKLSAPYSSSSEFILPSVSNIAKDENEGLRSSISTAMNNKGKSCQICVREQKKKVKAETRKMKRRKLESVNGKLKAETRKMKRRKLESVNGKLKKKKKEKKLPPIFNKPALHKCELCTCSFFDSDTLNHHLAYHRRYDRIKTECK